VVVGDTTFANPDLTYVVGGLLARGGIYVKRQGRKPLLVTSNLDVGSARKWGKVKRIRTFTQLGYEQLARKHGPVDAYPRLISSILRSEGVKGKVGLYGRYDLATGISISDRLRRLGAKITGETSPTILEVARETKSPEEINEVRRIGAKTGKVVQYVVETLRNMKRKRGHLQLGNKKATVGGVKKLISSALLSEELIAPEGTIFAIGASGADPHNQGVPTNEIKEGRLIVFDIFPQAETGYWFDMTRSFVVGRADRKAKRFFEAVYEAQTSSLDYLRPGRTGAEAMSNACDIIEKHGYRTLRDVYQGKLKVLNNGFNHGLGHGVGLTIGERPYLSLLSKEPLKEGQVVTVEPGIYFPGYGGLRIEDTVAIRSRGVDNLASVPKELELT